MQAYEQAPPGLGHLPVAFAGADGQSPSTQQVPVGMHCEPQARPARGTCWQAEVDDAPLQVSLVQGSPSSVQAAPAGAVELDCWVQMPTVAPAAIGQVYRTV